MEILMSQMGLSNESKAVSTPGVRMARSLVQRIELATDRARCGPAISIKTGELQFAVKELARRMQQPHTKMMQALVWCDS